MSIMPEGGWDDPPKQDSTQHVAVPEQPRYRTGYPTCKVCDRGTLSAKTVFRLSGPAVAIGFILLIPSVIGMFSCAVMLLALNTSIGVTLGINANGSSHPYQSAFDASFRRSCAQSTRQRSQDAGRLPTQPQIEEYCECALSAYKESGTVAETVELCTQRVNDGTLDTPSRDVDAFYSDTSSRTAVAGAALPIAFFGNSFLIAFGIAFFVSGLLGWLLVMKKQVLQCNLCGAVLNAS
ncbi:MAG: hypothetical protein ACLP07_15040 [Terracidiphilus sp.]